MMQAPLRIFKSNSAFLVLNLFEFKKVNNAMKRLFPVVVTVLFLFFVFFFLGTRKKDKHTFSRAIGAKMQTS